MKKIIIDALRKFKYHFLWYAVQLCTSYGYLLIKKIFVWLLLLLSVCIVLD